ncbi:BspA family leucine-rich repeat surface protein [Muricauda sp. SCSIO 64092]|uniref:BspA family leucine-rich repeat surface protein n=1 Tax=Allomuricauda sp. SCSIO 64092 TaxID=2908842 RepID=UPI001FF1D2C7|nr:BspA family leucine-rich repeat surface protein [Muricauda sp. SCSIO 64092]UOY05348.1 BspA family leucine-rich repeat surface protein [Muricauda sp. SCSIO 64092]
MKTNYLMGLKRPLFTFFIGLCTTTGLIAQSEFITTWDTTKSGTSDGNSITIPATGTYDVDLGNDGSYELLDRTGTITIDVTTYGHTAGEVQVALRNAASGTGTLDAIQFNYTGDRDKILSVDQWGSNISWSTMEGAFYGCSNLEVKATDVPDLSNVTNMYSMFALCRVVTGTGFSTWNTSGVTDMARIFRGADVFNGDIGSWDTSSVTDMRYMLNGAGVFNQDIGSWNTGSVTDMGFLFARAFIFDQDIGSWNVGNVTNMQSMFVRADAFDQDIGSWDVGKVTDMTYLFWNAGAFDRDIGSWNTGKVVDMWGMFEGAKSFNRDIGSWDTGKVTDMEEMFEGASAFDQDLGDWDMGQVTNGAKMLDNSGLSEANWDATLIGWAGQDFTNTPTIGASGLKYCTAGTQRAALTFNITGDSAETTPPTAQCKTAVTLQPGSSGTATLDTSLVDDGSSDTCGDVSLSLSQSSFTTSDLGANTVTLTVTDPNGNTDTCQSTVTIVDPIATFVTTWDTTKPGSSDGNSITIPATGTYDVDLGNDGSYELLDRTGALTVDVTAYGHAAGEIQVALRNAASGTGTLGAIQFSYRGDRDKLLSVDQWGSGISWSTMEGAFWGCSNLEVKATDVPDLSGVTNMVNMFNNCSSLTGTGLSTWNTGSVTNMGGMFSGATSFNGDISGWDTAGVTDMRSMFQGASSFNGNIGSWNTGRVTYMSFMFDGASAFDRDIGSWNTVSVGNMNFMFRNASAFNQDIGSWDTAGLNRSVGMFSGAVAFDQDLGDWYMGRLRNGTDMLNGSGLSEANWDATLIGWAGQDFTNTPTIGATGLVYCTAGTQRTALTLNITGDSAEATPPTAQCSTSITLLLGTGGTATLTTDLVDDGSSDTCGDVSLSLSQANFTTSDLGANTVTLTVTDPNGNTNTCQGTVTVVDSASLFLVTTWDTTKSGTSDGNSITIPATGTYDVDLGNDGSYELLDRTGTITIDVTTYGHTAGEVQVALRNAASGSGTLGAIQFNNTGDRDKLLSVDQWGSNISWSTMQNAFYGCSNLEVKATDVPDLSNVTNMHSMFALCRVVTGTGFSTWNTSGVTDMAWIFRGADIFNGDIGSWDTSSVTDMRYMLNGAGVFNQDIGSWDTGSVTDMGFLFARAFIFDQDIGSWNVGNVTNMQSMFVRADAFDQDIGSWDVGKVTDMTYLFWNAGAFDRDIGSWNTGKVVDMWGMFEGAKSFNRDIGSWDTGKVTDMEEMFEGASAFDQDLGGWDMGQVTNGAKMLDNSGLSEANWDATLIGWAGQDFTNTPTIGASGLKYCTAGAQRTALTLNITGDSAETTPPTAGCKTAVTLILGTDGTATLTTDLVDDGSSDTCGDVSLSLSQSSFTTSNIGANTVTLTVTDPNGNTNTCQGTVTVVDPASLFLVTTWDTTKPGSSDGNSITIPATGTYDVDLGNDGTYELLDQTDEITVNVTTHNYTAGQIQLALRNAASGTGTLGAIQFNYRGDRDKLLSVDQWGSGISWSTMEGAFWGCSNLEVKATDVPDLSGVTNMVNMFNNCSSLTGTGLSTWNTGSVTNMGGMFSGATSFNGDISGWDTAGVTDMRSMFQGAISFNGDIGSWNTGRVTYMSFMFDGASAFDRDIGSWNTGSVGTMNFMFRNASAFNQDIGSWSTVGLNRSVGMFSGAVAFDQDLGDWYMGRLRNGTDMLNGSGLSEANWDATLIGWAGQDFTNTPTIGATGLVYCTAGTQRTALTLNITGDSAEATPPTAQCRTSITLLLGTGGTATLTTDLVDDGSSDACGDVSLGLSQSSFTTSNLGANTVTLTVTDPNGNTNTCQGTVTVVDPASLFLVTTWDTTKSGTSDGNSITIPATGTYDVDLGNDGSYELLDRTGALTVDVTTYGHTAGEVQVALRNAASGTGTLGAIQFNNGGDRDKLLSVDQWGSDISWSTMQNAFYGCSNLEVKATDVPDLSNVTNMHSMFAFCRVVTGTGLSTWNTSGVTDMAWIFRGADVFNGDIGSWDTSSVTDMRYMLNGAGVFNQDIGSWNTGSVTDMGFLFARAFIFDQDIGSWNVGNVTNMQSMFVRADAFDQDIGSWDVAKVTNMRAMFMDVSAFDQDLGGWDMGQVTDGTNMLKGSGLSIANWDATLIGWDAQNFTNTPTIGASGLKYCTAETERAALTFNIVGDSKDCGGAGGGRVFLPKDGLTTDNDFSGLPNLGETESAPEGDEMDSKDLGGHPDLGKRGFSPNGDGINDTFSISWLRRDYPNYTMTVYDQNGILVYQGNAGTPDWDGSAAGGSTVLGDGKLHNGVYYYKIDFGDGKTPPVQGIVYLNR